MKTTQIEGSVAVGRNLYTGGSLTAGGSAHISRDLRVDGWLDAPNVKRDSKGLFLTTQALNEAYPFPEPGWWALVGHTLPADLYVESDGSWVATGGQGGQLTADTPSLTSLAEAFAAQIDRAESVLGSVKNVADTADEARETADEAMLAAHGAGIVPFDGMHSSGPRPRRGVWYVSATGDIPAHFAYVSSDWGYAENDYNEPDAPEGESPVRTDCLFRHGNTLWHFDGREMHALADCPVAVEETADIERLRDTGGLRGGQLYCVVEKGSRRITSMYLG